jgi:hypothetical protein
MNRVAHIHEVQVRGFFPCMLANVIGTVVSAGLMLSTTNVCTGRLPVHTLVAIIRV